MSDNSARAYMSLQRYITKVIEDFSTAQGNEIPGIKRLDFDIGVDTNFSANTIIVNPDSQSRIKFSLEVKRA